MINITNFVFILILLVLLFFVYSSYNKRKYDMFLFFLLLTIAYLPMMQYVVFPEYKKYDAQGIMYNGWDKVWLEYVLTIVLLLFNANIKLRNKNNYNNMFNIFIVGYALLSIPQFFTAIDLERSFNGYIISVLNPILYASLFNKVVSSKCKIRVSKLGKMMFSFFLVIFVFFFIITIYNVLRGVSTNADDDGGIYYFWGLGVGLGVFRTRPVLIAFFLFLPALFLPKTNPMRKQFSRFVLIWVLFVIMLFMANSRTMFVVFAVCVALVFLWNPFKNYRWLGFALMGVLLIGIVRPDSIGGLQNSFYERFHQKGSTIIESAENDERILIWKQATLAAENSNYNGIGISNFHLVYHKHYSDAHSLYYSQLAERGILAMIYVVIFLVTLVVKSLYAFHRTHNALFGVIAIGVLLYGIVAYTANDWMMISQVCYSWLPYLLFIYLSLLTNSKRIVNE